MIYCFWANLNNFMTVDVKKLYNYWLTEADYSWEIAKSLFGKRMYPECLFFAHLTVEKLLNAMVVAATSAHAPPIHNLARLASLAGVPITPEQRRRLEEWNGFYMAGRYDEEKMDFRKKCTKEYTTPKYLGIHKFFLWLKKEAEKNSPLK